MSAMKRAIRAGLLALLLVSCSGGQTGQPTSGECWEDPTPPSETLERFAGTYESPVTAPGNTAKCPSEADTVLHVEIEGDFDERESIERECFAPWLPVTVQLRTDDGEFEATEQGWLTTSPPDRGGVRIDEPSFGGGELMLELDAEKRAISSDRRLGEYKTFPSCCLEASSQSFSDLTGLDELGLVELLPSAPEVVGQESVALELRITTELPANVCFEEGMIDPAAAFELRDAEGTVVATGTGNTKSTPCTARPGCIWVQVNADGSVSDASYLGAAEPLKGQASRIFLEADFNTCETPALVELGISVDVQLEEYAIEMGLNPAPSSGIAPQSEGRPAQCF